ncbi:hypothetical protein FAI41_03335 [Acetobacteraceae bacterium]|nr:hypothetical protein FAI41_03335 [Acetobacteraceae bacterium]
MNLHFINVILQYAVAIFSFLAAIAWVYASQVKVLYSDYRTLMKNSIEFHGDKVSVGEKSFDKATDEEVVTHTQDAYVNLDGHFAGTFEDHGKTYAFFATLRKQGRYNSLAAILTGIACTCQLLSTFF